MGVFKFPTAHWMYKKYPTSKVDKMIPRMRYEIPDKEIKVRMDSVSRRRMFGPSLRLQAIAKGVTQLVRDERVEFTYYKAWEVRNYTERLIMEAIRYGDCHRPTMDLANFYLNEKNLIHKLFKVLVPRYINYSEAFTQMHLLPIPVEKTRNKHDPDNPQFVDRHVNPEAVLELKGNPLPSVRNEPLDSRNFLTNVLLRAAQKEYNLQKLANDKKNVN